MFVDHFSCRWHGTHPRSNSPWSSRHSSTTGETPSTNNVGSWEIEFVNSLDNDSMVGVQASIERTSEINDGWKLNEPTRAWWTGRLHGLLLGHIMSCKFSLNRISNRSHKKSAIESTNHCVCILHLNEWGPRVNRILSIASRCDGTTKCRERGFKVDVKISSQICEVGHHTLLFVTARLDLNFHWSSFTAF